MFNATEEIAVGSKVKKQEFSVDVRNAPLINVRVTDPDKTPSWRRYGKGFATLDLTVHADAKWISVWVNELTVPAEGERQVTKATSITINPEQAQALYNELKKIYGDAPCTATTN
jgi:hypothetical protein